jgi:hypothetical protein
VATSNSHRTGEEQVDEPGNPPQHSADSGIPGRKTVGKKDGPEELFSARGRCPIPNDSIVLRSEETSVLLEKEGQKKVSGFPQDGSESAKLSVRLSSGSC